MNISDWSRFFKKRVPFNTLLLKNERTKTVIGGRWATERASANQGEKIVICTYLSAQVQITQKLHHIYV